MLFWNQTKNTIVWDEPKPAITWDPFGSANVPEPFVPFVALQGLPVKATPVTPESRAQVIKEEAAESVRNDEMRAMQGEIEIARADLKSALASLDQERNQHAETKKIGPAKQLEIDNLKEQLRMANLDKEASEGLLAEMGRKLAEAQDTVLKVASTEAVKASAPAPASQIKPQGK